MNKLAEKYLLVIFFVCSALIMIASRWLPHPPNFTAVGGFLFVSGILATRSKWIVAGVFGALLISDFLLGPYQGLGFVYLGHALVLGLGYYFARGWGRSRWGTRSLAFAGTNLISSVAFFAVSNFGVWWSSGIYERTTAGLAQCFIMALPFFHQTVISHFIFGAILVGAYFWARARVLAGRQAFNRI